LLDTVKLGFKISPSNEQLEKWELKVNSKYEPTRTTRFMSLSWLRFEEGSIRVKYYPQNVNTRPEPLLLIEMSLPKLVYGNNIQEIFSTSRAIEKGNQIIGQYSHIPRVDLNEGILYRIDLCHNFQVGAYVSEWIRQLYKLEYPRRKTKPYYPSQGVQYFSKRASLSFYNKEDECKNVSAHGILRMEASYRDKNQIGKLVGKSLATIGDFTSEGVVSHLNGLLQKLGIKDQAPADSLGALRILMNQYSSEQAVRLNGFLMARQIASSKELKAMGMVKQTISRSTKQIRAAGLSMCVADNVFPLPKLVINPRSTVE